jgi:outer membrane protein assembly factor BamB
VSQARTASPASGDAGNGAVVQTSASTGASLDEPLLIQDSVLYATPATNKLYAFDMTDLSTNWNLTVSGTNSGPCFSGVESDNIYLAVGTEVQKVTDNTTSGSSVWSQDFSATVNSGPIEYNSKVYFGRNSGRYYAVNASTGIAVGDWPYYSASGDANVGPWIDVTNSRVVFGTSGGNLHAFSLE